MTIEDNKIINLKDLNSLRTAPRLNKKQSEKLLNEAEKIIFKADWLTIGIMAPSIGIGIDIIKGIEEKLKLNDMKFINIPTSHGPIFLKANQRTGEIHARIEYGLGEGILISCHNNDDTVSAETIGPFPLDFFE